VSRNPYDLPYLVVSLAAIGAVTGSFGVSRHQWWLVQIAVLASTFSAVGGILMLSWLRSLDHFLIEAGRPQEKALGNRLLLPGMKHVVMVLERLKHRLGETRGSLLDLQGRMRGKGGRLREAVQSVRGVVEGRSGVIRDQLHAVKRVSGAWDQINDMSQRIASQAEEVERASSQVSSTGEEGARASQEAVGEMDQVRIAVVAVAERMRNLRRASEKVSETARAIDQVSTQINLLALNAAIEAAGAGEFGERFGVVAVEVKRLADQTVVATRMIKDLLGEIQLEVAEGIQLTEQGALSVEKGFARVQQLEQVLTGLNGAIEIADRNAKSILGSTKVQVFAVRNARKEVEGIERTLVFQGGPEEVLSGTVAELQRMANDLDEVDPDTI
jgi:methyl-accepting chemotaxis protein